MKECNSTRKTNIFEKKKWSYPDQIFTLVTMVFENFLILTKIIQSKSSIHFERIYRSTCTSTDPNSTWRGHFLLSTRWPKFFVFKNFTKSWNKVWVPPFTVFVGLNSSSPVSVRWLKYWPFRISFLEFLKFHIFEVKLKYAPT